MLSSVTGAKAPPPKKPEPAATTWAGHRPGIVSVIDLKCINVDKVSFKLGYYCLSWIQFQIEQVSKLFFRV